MSKTKVNTRKNLVKFPINSKATNSSGENISKLTHLKLDLWVTFLCCLVPPEKLLVKDSRLLQNPEKRLKQKCLKNSETAHSSQVGIEICPKSKREG